MRYKIRVYYLDTNKEALTINEVYKSIDAVENAIEKLKIKNPNKYHYVKVPILK
jgi:uncharacterized protein YegP (UPF0339 family)